MARPIVERAHIDDMSEATVSVLSFVQATVPRTSNVCLAPGNPTVRRSSVPGAGGSALVVNPTPCTLMSATWNRLSADAKAVGPVGESVRGQVAQAPGI